jgi:hypothetical protein
MHLFIRSLIICVGIAGAASAQGAPKAPRPTAAKATPSAAPKAAPRAAAAKATPSAAPKAAPRAAAAKRTPPAAPKVDPGERYRVAEQHRRSGDRKQALTVLEEGLEAAPKDRDLRDLRYLRCMVLFELDDHAAALTACQAFVEVSEDGARRVQAKKTVDTLTTRMTTFLEVTVSNGPANVYLGLKSRGVFCRATPSCKGSVAPGAHKVIVERPGFDEWTGRVTVAAGQTEQLAVTLVEKPSLLTVRATPPEARVTVDDEAYEAPTPVDPGKHRVTVSLEGHAEERLEVTARQGRPIELEVALAPIVPLQIEPPGAAVELLLDGKLVQLQDGGIPVPAGARELRVRASGFHDERIELPAERGADDTIPVRLRRVELAPAPPSIGGPLPLPRKLALAAGGVALTAVSAGALLGLQSRQLADDAVALCPSPSSPCATAPQANDLNRRGQARALQANVAFGVAGGGAIAATVLWLTGAPEARVAVTPRLDTIAGLDLTVRY